MDWDEAIERIDEILKRVDMITAPGLDFADSVRRTLASIRSYTEIHQRITPRQEQAVENMARGVDAWLEANPPEPKLVERWERDWDDSYRPTAEHRVVGAPRRLTTADYAAQVLCLPVGPLLGAGGFGEVYALPNDHAIKFTHADAERVCVTWILRQQQPLSPHLPRVVEFGLISEYEVRWANPAPKLNDHEGTGPTFWYIREELAHVYGGSRQLTPELHHAISLEVNEIAWRLWDEHRLWLLGDFARLSQWGRREDGTLVLRDLACGTADEGVDNDTQRGGRRPETEPPPWYGERAGL